MLDVVIKVSLFAEFKHDVELVAFLKSLVAVDYIGVLHFVE